MTHATIEMTDISCPNKIVIGTVDVDLTDAEVKELRESYKSAKEDEECLSDRMYCNTVVDAADVIAGKIGVDYYDFGDTKLTFSDGTTETIENPWY